MTRYARGAPGIDAGDVNLGTIRARASALLMLALPGAAYVYQGEELGLPEVTDLPLESLTDPMFHRSNGARRGRNGCRVPLPWTSDQPGFGFAPVDPWLPQPDWFADHSVERQETSGESMLELYLAAVRLRRCVPALASDEFRWLPTEPGVLAFSRGRRLRLRRQLLVPAGRLAGRRAPPAGQPRRGRRQTPTEQRRLVPLRSATEPADLAS